MIHFHIVTLFPESIEPYMRSSIIGRAQKDKKIKISFYNPRDFTADPRERVDRRPYGGGPGMVLWAEPMLKAVQKALPAGRQGIGKRKADVIFLTPGGAQFDERKAQALSKPARRGGKKDIVLICGHYEGIDARVAKILKAKQLSIGPYVLTGGELPAGLIVDAVSRFVPGILGKAESLEAARVSSSEVYTRPEVFTWKGKKYRVPKVLLSGNHARINEWKKRTPHG